MAFAQTVPNSSNGKNLDTSTVEAFSLLSTDKIPPYEVRSSEFAYHLGCNFCRNERAHTVTQHFDTIAVDTNARMVRTVDQIIAQQAKVTDKQRSLAWAPMPPPEPLGAHDCRVGGSCGLDFNHETRRSRWVVARFRRLKEEKRLGAAVGGAQ